MLFNSKRPPKRFRSRPKKHEITCGKCGKKDSVSFRPKGIGPVLCNVCYNKKKKLAKIQVLVTQKRTEFQFSPEA